MIQQLQEELLQLSKLQLRGEQLDSSRLPLSDSLYPDKGTSDTKIVARLKGKLQTAARHIATLAREKQQLIEVGNRLRAELKKHGMTSVLSVGLDRVLLLAVNDRRMSHTC